MRPAAKTALKRRFDDLTDSVDRSKRVLKEHREHLSVLEDDLASSEAERDEILAELREAD